MSLTDRIAPNRSLPLIDRGFFRLHLGRWLGLLANRSSWFRDLLDAATSARQDS